MDEDVDVEASDHSESEVLDVEDPFARRREELKDMRTRLLVLRRSAQNADKKTKKAIQAQVQELETSIENRRAALELEQRQIDAASEALSRSLGAERATALRARKQAKKQSKEEQEQHKREEALQAAALIPKLGQQEELKLQTVLEPLGLVVHRIDADGSCLFNAIAHQLAVRANRHFSSNELRELAAVHIEENAEKYDGFLEEPIEEYCSKLRGTELWGGHLELDALADALHVPIIVYQAESEQIKFAEHYSGPALLLCFRQHAYSLGEHYDSLVDQNLSVQD